jgi:Na+-driven multidrug efflux pump
MVGGVLNCVLDYVFMAKQGMGIRGAAIATVIGYYSTIGYAVWFYVIARKSAYRLELARPNWREIGEICFNGSSDMVSNLAQGVTVLFMNHLAYHCYGESGVSALTVVTYVQVLIMLLFMGFTSAVEPVFSYHYGSGNTRMRKKVYRLSMAWCMAMGTVSMVLLFLLHRQVIGVFFDRGTDFYEIAEQGYLLSLPACLFVGVNIFGSGLFTAFSNGLVSGLLSLVRTFVVLTACLFVLTALFGGPGLWSAWPAAELICAAITVAVLKKYRRVYQY